MHLALRSRLATLVPLLLLMPVTALVAGCSSDADVDGDGPTVTATGPDETTDAPTEQATVAATDEPSGAATDEPSGTPSDLPDAVAAVCGPYIEMSRAIKNAAFGGADRDAIAAAITPVMKRFAARVPDLERPPAISAATWHGVEALAEHILELPDEPTYAEIEAVEGELSDQEREAFDAAAVWLRTNCSL